MIKFSVDHKSFLTGLNTVAAALPPKTSLPSLSNILIETLDDKLKIAATDLDTTVITFIPATITTPGAVTLPGKKLLEIVRELNGNEVDISTTGSRISISCNKSNFSLPTSSRDSYPSLPSTEINADSITFPIGILKEGIKRTVYAIAGSSELRAALTGCLWKQTELGLVMVSTDGHRLAKVILPSLKTETEKEFSAIVAPKALNLLLKINSEDSVIMSSQGTQISFHIGETSIFSRIIEGVFPPYDKVIPANNEILLELNKKDLYDALRRMRIIANPATQQVIFTIEHNRLILQAENTDAGEAREDIEAVFNSDPIQIAFSGNLITEILKTMNSEDIVMKLHDSEVAVIFVEKEKNADIEYLTLVMPVKLPDNR